MATNPDEALAAIVNAPHTDDGEPTEEIEIVLTDDDLGGQSLADLIGDDTQQAETGDDSAAGETGDDTVPGAAADDATGEPPRQRRPRAQARIEELTAEREAIAAERDQMATQLAAARAAEAEAVRAAVFNHHAALETRAEGIKAKLLEAKRNGENETEVELQAQFNRVTTEMAEAKEWLESAPAPRAAPAAEPAPRAVPEQRAAPTAQPQVPPETAAWIGRNSWFNQASPDFDPEMHGEARLYANKIERRYIAEGKQAQIGSQAYFMEIDRHVRAEFPDAFDEPAPAVRGVPPMARDATVAPVQRAGAPAPGAQPSSRSVRLSPEQRSLAHSMADNGAMNKADGSRPTHAEAERMYAAQILKQQARN